MTDQAEHLFSGGQPNPNMAGIPLRGSVSGADLSAERIAEAAVILSRPVQYVDAQGAEQEIMPPHLSGQQQPFVNDGFVVGCDKEQFERDPSAASAHVAQELI